MDMIKKKKYYAVIKSKIYMHLFFILGLQQA